jgi:hypothetical protein
MKDTIEFNHQQTQVLFGTLLGDANIQAHGVYSPGSQSKLTVEHTTKQMGLALFKADVLGLKTFTRDKYDERSGKTYHSIVAYSQTSPTYSDLYDSIYKEDRSSKRLDEDILYSLTPLGLSVWYMDDGNLDVNSRTITLCTEAFNYEEHLTIKEYFKARWGLEAKIQKRTHGKYRIRFSVEDTYKFIEIVKPFILPDLAYKTNFRPYKRKPQWYKDIIADQKEEVN